MCSATPAASSRALTTPCRGHIRLRATSTRSRTGPAVFAVGLSLVEIGGRHARDFQVDLDPIEQWAGHLGAVSLGGARVDREGFTAATNGKSAGKRAWCAAREIITEPVSSGSRTASSRCRSNCGSSGRKKCRGGRARAPRSRVRTFTNQLDGLDGCGGGGRRAGPGCGSWRWACPYASRVGRPTGGAFLKARRRRGDGRSAAIGTGHA